MAPRTTGDQVHDLFAASLAIERALDGLDLTPDAAHPRQELLLFADRMRHGLTMHSLPTYSRVLRKWSELCCWLWRWLRPYLGLDEVIPYAGARRIDLNLVMRKHF